ELSVLDGNFIAKSRGSAAARSFSFRHAQVSRELLLCTFDDGQIILRTGQDGVVWILEQRAAESLENVACVIRHYNQAEIPELAQLYRMDRYRRRRQENRPKQHGEGKDTHDSRKKISEYLIQRKGQFFHVPFLRDASSALILARKAGAQGFILRLGRCLMLLIPPFAKTAKDRAPG